MAETFLLIQNFLVDTQTFRTSEFSPSNVLNFTGGTDLGRIPACCGPGKLYEVIIVTYCVAWFFFVTLLTTFCEQHVVFQCVISKKRKKFKTQQRYARVQKDHTEHRGSGQRAQINTFLISLFPSLYTYESVNPGNLSIHLS